MPYQYCLIKLLKLHYGQEESAQIVRVVRGADQSQAGYWRSFGPPREEGHGQPFLDWKAGGEGGGLGS